MARLKHGTAVVLLFAGAVWAAEAEVAEYKVH